LFCYQQQLALVWCKPSVAVFSSRSAGGPGAAKKTAVKDFQVVLSPDPEMSGSQGLVNPKRVRCLKQGAKQQTPGPIILWCVFVRALCKRVGHAVAAHA